MQLNQIGAQMKQIELQVANDVTSAAIAVQNNAELVRASETAVQLQQAKLDAEQAKLDVGMSTNYNVVLAQRDLATSKNTELSAIAQLPQGARRARASAADHAHELEHHDSRPLINDKFATSDGAS